MACLTAFCFCESNNAYPGKTKHLSYSKNTDITRVRKHSELRAKMPQILKEKVVYSLCQCCVMGTKTLNNDDITFYCDAEQAVDLWPNSYFNCNKTEHALCYTILCYTILPLFTVSFVIIYFFIKKITVFDINKRLKSTKISRGKVKSLHGPLTGYCLCSPLTDPSCPAV